MDSGAQEVNVKVKQQAKNSGMVVRSLLFPAFDSGANATFKKKQQQQLMIFDERVDSNVDDKREQSKNDEGSNVIDLPKLSLTPREDEVETEVMHNHSPMSNSRKKVLPVPGAMNPSPGANEEDSSHSSFSTPSAGDSNKVHGVPSTRDKPAPKIPSLGDTGSILENEDEMKETSPPNSNKSTPISLSPRTSSNQIVSTSISPSKPRSISKQTPQVLSSPLRRAKCWSLDTMGEAVAYKNVSPPLSPMDFKNFRIDPSVQNSSTNSPHTQQTLRESHSWDMQRNKDYTKSKLINSPSMLQYSPSSSKISNGEKVRRKSSNSVDDTVQNYYMLTPGANANTFRNTEWRKHVVSCKENTNTKSNLPKSQNEPNVLLFSGESPDVSRIKPIELMSPQRIEIEREDALDILSCLVDRSVVFHQRLDENSSKNENEENSSNDKTPKASNTTKDSIDDQDIPATLPAQNLEVQETHITDGKHGTESAFGPNVRETVNFFRNLSEKYEKGTTQVDPDAQENNKAPKHGERIKVLDELQRCFEFSQEMERAALSASGWLKAIGRPSPQFVEANGTYSLDDPLIYSYSTTCSPEKNVDHQKDPSDDSNSSIMVATIRAHLHDARQKLEENERFIEQLNTELSTCRAEIGRLKTSSRSKSHMPFTSPNRSIFDEESSECSSAINEDLVALETALGDVENTDSTYSVSSEEGNSLEKALNENAEIKREMLLLKGTLHKANKKINNLTRSSASVGDNDETNGIEDLGLSDGDQVGLTDQSSCKNVDGDESFLLDPALYKELKDYEESLRKSDLVTIQDLKSKLASFKHDTNNALLNKSSDENFVTDWNEIASLPPPPDHGLNSPIVNTILSQWTNDEVMHDSLLYWMENVLDNSSHSDDVLPLKISNLDHRVRDGFIMHVLPLLMRRPDIQVHVNSRAQRRTTYDIAVSVSPNSKNSYSMLSPRQQPQQPNSMSIMAFQASRGNGIYEQPDEQQAHKLTRAAALSAAEDVRNKVSGLFRASIPTQRNSDATKADFRNQPAKSPSSPYQSFTTLHEEHSISSEKSKDGLMGTIGGAFGGLLNRRKGAKLSVSFDESDEWSSSPHDPQSGRHKNSNASNSPGQNKYDPIEFKRVSSAPTGKYSRSAPSQLPPIPPSPEPVSTMGSKSFDVKDDHANNASSFHRVVSAPPGRIGVTFVQYRGHAMVSEVSLDSPLVGWIFRSDILVAVDDVAVSGLPVREIVKIISSKADSDRSLRVVSSHDIQDFTQNSFHNSLNDIKSLG